MKTMSNLKFYYFGFASNMLSKRIHIKNPTATRIGPGKLENYRLDFNTNSKLWKGAPATILQSMGCDVYGAIWEIDNINLKDLDEQEGVNDGIYIPINVRILSLNTNQIIICRAYQLTRQPDDDVRFMTKESVPYHRMPSKSYLKTIVKGAIETGLNENYIAQLRQICHNSKEVENIEKEFELSDIEL